jgi:hypothetical protein
MIPELARAVNIPLLLRPDGQGKLGRSKRRWKNNIKMDF